MFHSWGWAMGLDASFPCSIRGFQSTTSSSLHNTKRYSWWLGQSSRSWHSRLWWYRVIQIKYRLLVFPFLSWLLQRPRPIRNLGEFTVVFRRGSLIPFFSSQPLSSVWWIVVIFDSCLLLSPMPPRRQLSKWQSLRSKRLGGLHLMRLRPLGQLRGQRLSVKFWVWNHRVPGKKE